MFDVRVKFDFLTKEEKSVLVWLRLGGGVGEGMPITMGMRCQRPPREVRGVETSTSLPMKFVEIANR